jgi:hypothetical protein
MVVSMVSKAGALALAIGLVTGCSSDHQADGDVVSSLPPTASVTTSATVSLPRQLQGTWRGAATVTLEDCSVGVECGLVERVDDNNEHCEYALVYLGLEANRHGFRTGRGNSFGCAYSPWADGILIVEQLTDDSISVFIDGGPTVIANTTATLSR